MQGLSNGFAGLNLFMQVSISPLSNVLHEIHCMKCAGALFIAL